MKKAPTTQLIDQSHIVKLQSVLMFLAFLFGALYIYSIGISVTYAVSEKQLAQQKKVLASEVLTLESDVLTRSQNSSNAHGQGVGLVALTEKAFITSDTLGSATPIR
jgi:RNA 3'-terminal phosphate cyclase